MKKLEMHDSDEILAVDNQEFVDYTKENTAPQGAQKGENTMIAREVATG